MPAFFKPHHNTVFRVGVFAALALPLVVIGGLIVFARSPLATLAYYPDVQPVQFDHRHHAGDEGIDCRYCHSSVEVSSTAGYPPIETCMGCHNQIWNHSELLAPVRDAYFSGRAIPWLKVYRLPDYVFFSHAIHVNKGIGCVSCHGRVDLQGSIEKASTLTMQWCLACHRDPENYLRPLDQITSMEWTPPGTGLRKRLMKEYDVHPKTDCNTCHR